MPPKIVQFKNTNDGANSFLRFQKSPIEMI